MKEKTFKRILSWVFGILGFLLGQTLSFILISHVAGAQIDPALMAVPPLIGVAVGSALSYWIGKTVVPTAMIVIVVYGFDILYMYSIQNVPREELLICLSAVGSALVALAVGFVIQQVQKKRG